MAEQLVTQLDRGAIDAMLESAHPVTTMTADWARANLAQHDMVEHDRESIFAAAVWKRCGQRGGRRRLGHVGHPARQHRRAARSRERSMMRFPPVGLG